MKMLNMQDPRYQKLLESSWKRPLTEQERAEMGELLTRHPEAHPELEASLTRLLNRLPDAPVSTNFTAQVLQAAQRAPASRFFWPAWLTAPEWPLSRWAARLALASLAVCAGMVSFHEAQATQQKRTAAELASVIPFASVPKVEWLKNFSTIQSLSQVPVADDEILIRFSRQ